MRACRIMLVVSIASLWLVTAGMTGCAVPQRPGNGSCMRLTEPETGARYWLYLPEDYIDHNGQHPNNQRWPMVLTLHGLKPYDNANPQVRSWQQEADRYGFVVVAPELKTCDSLKMQFPLHDPTLDYVQADERAVLAIMDEVFRRTNADPTRVLATSFSSGGYMAHFLVNRYPERFCCLAVRGSNFNEQMLNPSQITKYRNMPIAIFFGENDFPVCRQESLRALDWYRRYRFSVEGKQIAGLGHERRPQTAAAFFAAVIGVTPKTPPELGTLVMQDVFPAGSHRSPTRLPEYPRPVPLPFNPGNTPYSNTPQSSADVEPVPMAKTASLIPSPDTNNPTDPSSTDLADSTLPPINHRPTPKRPH